MLQWLDERPESLLHIQDAGDKNPLFLAERFLARVVSAGRSDSSPLAPLYRLCQALAPQELTLDRYGMAKMANGIALDMGSQLEFRL